MLKKLLGFLLAAICVMALGGCMSDAPQSGDGYTVTDARGKTLHMKEKPKRIISTYILQMRSYSIWYRMTASWPWTNGSMTRVYLWQSRVQGMSRQRSITVLST